MIPINQTKLHNPPEESGNCLAACIASIFEVPIDIIPEFEGENWYLEMMKFVEILGFEMLRWDEEVVLKGYYIVNGKSPRGSFDHVVIFKNGKMVHDPHPSKKGIENIKWCLAFLPLHSIGKLIPSTEIKFRAIISENTIIYFRLIDLIRPTKLFSIRNILIPWLLNGNRPDRFIWTKDSEDIYENDKAETPDAEQP